MQKHNSNKLQNDQRLNDVDTKIIQLSKNPSFLSAQELVVSVVSLLGIQTPERSKFSFILDQKFIKNEPWFLWHDIFPDKRAGEILKHTEGVPVELKVYWVNKVASDRIKGIVRFTDNYEDNKRTRDDQKTLIGIDFIIHPKADGITIALSNNGSFRVLELKGKLNNTQKKVLSSWIEISSGENHFERSFLHQSLWDSFGLRTVNEDFYDMIAASFTELKQHLENNNIFNEEDSKQFSNRLVGRLLFVWFLRKKNFISNEKIKYFETNNLNDDDYYSTRLERLFFDTLNKPIELRDVLYDDLKTPYLNGGLFYKQENDTPKNKLFFPKGFFTRLYKNLDEYNFTTDESTPDFEQVAIDPEMLGRVFENLLASMITETGEQARRAKGAFYTPREIVQYMCRESVRQFLYTSLGKAEYKEEIDRLIDTPDYEWANNESNKVRDISKKGGFGDKVVGVLKEMKSIDPACGSGAFPIGMLQTLMRIYTRLNRNLNEYEVKLMILENNIYGVDIEPMAVEISRLRAFLALVVDQEYNEKNKNGGIDTLPNLEFKFVCANTLVKLDKSTGLYDGMPSKGKKKQIDLQDELTRIKKKYFKADWRDKQKLERELDQKLSNAGLFESKKYEQLRSYHPIRQVSPASFYDPILMHDVDDGFNIVIGNPPYGGEKISDELKDSYGLASRDMYGAFISRVISGDDSLLKKDGLLSFIVSDTFMTIKSHLPLRKQILNQKIIRMIRVHPDTFKATVNTAVIFIQKTDKGSQDICEMSDLTNISIHDEYDKFLNVLDQTRKEDSENISTDEYAIYYYLQSTILTNSNFPFFVSSPKLFLLMNDINAKTTKKNIFGNSVQVREIKINKHTIELVKFGEVAEVRQGLATGDNKYYLFQNSDARGNYKKIQDYIDYLLTEEDLKRLGNNEEIKQKAINKGFHKRATEDNFDRDLWFDGRYIVPYDKGGESDAVSGFLPNYYVPTDYFIDWSQEAIMRMHSLTIIERDKLYGKVSRSSAICAVIRSPDTYFKKGITASRVGMYSPTYRQSADSAYDSGCSNIFFNGFDRNYVLGVLSSKLFKLFFKSTLNHTVNSQVDDTKEIPFTINENKKIINLVSMVIEKQKKDHLYDYMSNEQHEIDTLVYEMYGLNDEDIQEVEKWYARRYPKLRKWCYIK